MISQYRLAMIPSWMTDWNNEFRKEWMNELSNEWMSAIVCMYVPGLNVALQCVLTPQGLSLQAVHSAGEWYE